MSKLQYCFDANIIFDIWHKDKGRYPMDILGGLWKSIQENIDTGRILSVKDVYEELKAEELLGEDYKNWLSTHKKIFKEVDQDTKKYLIDILKKYPLLASGNKDVADPVLVAYAKASSLVVLTSENNPQNASPYQPRIPNLCVDFNVSCMGVWDYCREEKLSFD